MDGIVPLAFSCLTSASVLAPDKAKNVADEFALILFDRVNLKTQPNGIHLFLDIEQLAHAAASELIASVLGSRNSSNPWAIEGRPNPLTDAKDNSGVDGLLAGLRRKGALLPPGILSAIDGGRPHQELLDIVSNRPSGDQSLIGFGVHVRQATAGDPWTQWKEPGLGHVAAWPHVHHNTGKRAPPDHERRWPLPRG
jgi:hypothetical protein